MESESKVCLEPVKLKQACIKEAKHTSNLIIPRATAVAALEGLVERDVGKLTALVAANDLHAVLAGPVDAAPAKVLADGLLVLEPFMACRAWSHFQIPHFFENGFGVP